VIKKNVKLGRKNVDGQIPQGTISVATRKSRSIPVTDQRRPFAIGDFE